ncbi:DUF1580 domain-containing protein [Neorhodopirellula lusitana]|uniref:DUF1580 domain-containing protein n=1 Tax=Neorhodopirellula lusitana TaxID=445327 RepID=UPI00384DC6C6
MSRKMDILTEDLVTLPQAAKGIPCPAGSRPPHYTTVYRWTKTGIGGERLESIRVGSQLLTSTQAMSRFLERINIEAA